MPETSTDDGGPPPQRDRLRQWLEFLGKHTEVRFFRFEMNGPAWVVLCGLALRVTALLLAMYILRDASKLTGLVAVGASAGATLLLPTVWPSRQIK